MKAKVYVTLKAGVLDPQGEAVRRSLGALGFDGVEAVQVMLGVLERCRLTGILQPEPFISAAVENLLETDANPDSEWKAYAVAVIKSIKELIQLNPLYKEELGLFMQHSSLQDPGRLGDFAAALTTSSPAEMQDILVDGGANVHFTAKGGRTALHKAANNGNVELIRGLLSGGADVNATDNWGRTALHNATLHGYVEIVHLLVEGGADVNAEDEHERTALNTVHLARRAGCTARHQVTTD